MPTVFTAATVKTALRDARAGTETAVSDSKVPGLQIRTWRDGSCKWSVRTRYLDRQRRYDLGNVCEARSFEIRTNFTGHTTANFGMQPEIILLLDW